MSRKSERLNPLRRLALFADASDVELQRASSLLTLLTAEAGTVLINEGSIGLEFLIIADGQAAVTTGAGEARRVLAVLGAGDFVGEMALLERVPRTATVTAVTPVSFYVANTAEFRSLLEAVPSVGERITRAAADRARANRRAA